MFPTYAIPIAIHEVQVARTLLAFMRRDSAVDYPETVIHEARPFGPFSAPAIRAARRWCTVTNLPCGVTHAYTCYYYIGTCLFGTGSSVDFDEWV